MSVTTELNDAQSITIDDQASEVSLLADSGSDRIMLLMTSDLAYKIGNQLIAASKRARRHEILARNAAIGRKR